MNDPTPVVKEALEHAKTAWGKGSVIVGAIVGGFLLPLGTDTPPKRTCSQWDLSDLSNGLARWLRGAGLVVLEVDGAR
jgi:hypothetical protein